MSNNKNSSTPKKVTNGPVTVKILSILEELIQLRDFCTLVAKERLQESQRMAMVYFRDPSDEGAKVLAIEHGAAAETHTQIGNDIDKLQRNNRP